MYNDDLIARWKAVKLGPNGYCSSPLVELIADTIDALLAQAEDIEILRNELYEKAEPVQAPSPVLPEEVQRAVKFLQSKEIDQPGCRNAADLIERLARENATFDGTIGFLLDQTKEQKARIEELERENELLDASNKRHQEALQSQGLKLDHAKNRIRELEGGVHSCGPNCQRPLCAANRRIEELENTLDEEQPDKAEIIELRKAVQIYSDIGKTQRAKIAEYEKALKESKQNAEILESARSYDVEIIQSMKKTLETIEQTSGERTTRKLARTELERIRGME